MFYNNKLLLQLKKQFTKTLPTIKGYVKFLNKKLVILETNKNYIYHILDTHLTYVMEGDYILAQSDINNFIKVIPIKLIKSNISIFQGTIKIKNNIIYIIPEEKILYKNIIQCSIKKKIIKNLKNNDKVFAKIIKHPLNKEDDVFIAEITNFLTINNQYLLPWWNILLKYNLSIDAPSNSLCKEIKFLDEKIYRKDLTNLCFITIDNKDTKDIDDAFYIEEISDEKLLIYVAIADPTSYIDQNNIINKIASKRIFTTYLPGLTIPLLPKILSEDLCSLNPKKKRPVLICQMIINKNGSLSKKIVFFTGWIKSHAKLNYENVSNWIEEIGNWTPDNNEIEKQILFLYKFYIYRKKWNIKNITSFNNIDYKFIFGKKGTILDIVIEKKRIAHKMIENIMITANICASEFLYHKLNYGIYNVYYGFNINKINKIIKLLKEHNIECNESCLMTLEGYKNIFRKLKDLNLLFILNKIKKYQLISLFSIKPGPHFALGLKRYATWTSPIRKFGDIINHRLIKSIIYKKKFIMEQSLNNIHIEMNHKRFSNKQAKKDISNFLYFQYFKNIAIHNKVFLSEIIDISFSGIRVRLIKNGAYAFVPKKFLYKSNININPEKGIMLIKNKFLYKITDKINVIIKKININNILVKII